LPTVKKIGVHPAMFRALASAEALSSSGTASRQEPAAYISAVRRVGSRAWTHAPWRMSLAASAELPLWQASIRGSRNAAAACPPLMPWCSRRREGEDSTSYASWMR